MPQEVRRIANNYMINPEEITIGTKNSGAETVSHHAYIVHSKDRYVALKRLADYYPDIYGIVFCRTRQETKDIADKLMSDGYNADALHGDLSQAQRDYVMKKFRNKNLQILVATDVAARGLDVQNLSHVINFSIPDDIETYTHRSGRTGRAGKEGISIAILNLKEKGKLKQIERLIKKTFEIKQVPDGKEICNIKILDLIEKIKSVEVNEEKIGSFMKSINNAFADMSKEEIIQHFVSYEFNRILEYYENAPDINVDSSRESGRERDRDGRNRRDRDKGNTGEERKDRVERGERRERRFEDVDRSNYTRFFINVGKKEDLDKSKMLKLLNEHANDRDIQYGAIDILKSFSFFEVDSKYTSKILSSFAHATYQGRPISVEIAQAPTGKAARGSKNDFIKGDNYTSKYSRDTDRRDRGGSDRRDRSNSYERGFKSSGRRNKNSDGGGRKRY